MNPPTREQIEEMVHINRVMKNRTMLFEEWENNFKEYNKDHKFAPLHMHCRSCYHKVYAYLKKKRNAKKEI